MNIELTEKEVEQLAEIAYCGEMMISGAKDKPTTKEHRVLLDKIYQAYKQAKPRTKDVEGLVEYKCDKHIKRYSTRVFEETFIDIAAHTLAPRNPNSPPGIGEDYYRFMATRDILEQEVEERGFSSFVKINLDNYEQLLDERLPEVRKLFSEFEGNTIEVSKAGVRMVKAKPEKN